MSDSLDLQQADTVVLPGADDDPDADWAPQTSCLDFAAYARPEMLDNVELFHGRFSRHVFPRHAHPYHYCLSIVLEGTLQIDWSDHQAIVEPGVILVVEPGQAHGGRCPDAKPFRVRTTYIPTTAFSALGIEQPHFEPAFSDPHLFALIRELHRDVERDESNTSPALFSAILRRLSEHAIGDARPRVHPAVLSSISFIENEVASTTDIALHDLAARVGLHPVYLSRLFTRTTGMPPHAYWMSVRLHLAKQRLSGGEDIAWVAADLGFTDQSHLSRLFKRSFGITPGAYSTRRLKTYNTHID